MFTTAGSAEAESWRRELLEHLGISLGQGADVGDHRRYTRAWVSCKLDGDEAWVQVSTPPTGLRLSPAGGGPYDIQKIDARDAAEEILQRILPEIESRRGYRRH